MKKRVKMRAAMERLEKEAEEKAERLVRSARRCGRGRQEAPRAGAEGARRETRGQGAEQLHGPGEPDPEDEGRL
jgi:hypothetical protein